MKNSNSRLLKRISLFLTALTLAAAASWTLAPTPTGQEPALAAVHSEGTSNGNEASDDSSNKEPEEGGGGNTGN